MKEDEKKLKEIAVYTAESSAIAAMLVERLGNLHIPARLGSDSPAAGVFGVNDQSRTILVPKDFEEQAREMLEVR